MIISNIEGTKRYSYVKVKCYLCFSEREILLISALRDKTNEHLCKKCSAKKSINKKPQCKKEYWTDDKIQKIKDSIKNSEIYQEGIKNRDQSGEKNSMYGKKASKETREKMSESRTGKIQSSETIEKRIKTIKEKIERDIQEGKRMISSINSELRRVINGFGNRWSFRVMERDGWNCTKCSSIERLDAHHIKPISIIIKELTEGISFERDLDKYNFLKDNEFILDTDLKNGICLCRKCHKEVHKNWGSHKPEY